jgi:hypothetical protein
MLKAVRKYRRFRFAIDVLRSGAGIELSDTPVAGQVKKLFYTIDRSSAYSNEASVAILLLLFSILTVEDVCQRTALGEDTSVAVAIPFTRVPQVIRTMILTWEMKTPDRDRYERDVGQTLKAEFNAAWKRLQDQSERKQSQS